MLSSSGAEETMAAVHCRTHRSPVPPRAGIPDETLLEYARRGDGSAWNALVDRYRGLVRSQAVAFFFPGADIDDVIQEGMVGLCKAVRDYRVERPASFAVFARLCIRRQIVSALKGALRGKHRPLNTARSLEEPLDGADDRTLLGCMRTVGDGPEAIVLRDLAQTTFEVWMREKLAPLERTVVRSYLEGRPYGEIARSAGCKVKAVDNALQRVKRKIKRTGPSLSVDS
jgi:RNA polymerase sporulation-specific sigma factor